MAPSLRSGEIDDKSPVKSPHSNPIEPSTPSVADSLAPPICSPSLGLGLGFDSSVPDPPRRRSFRLAGVSIPSPQYVDQSVRKRQPGMAARVDDSGVDPLLSFDANSGDEYMSLRSGSRITKRKVEAVGAEDGEGMVDGVGSGVVRRRFSEEEKGKKILAAESVGESESEKDDILMDDERVGEQSWDGRADSGQNVALAFDEEVGESSVDGDFFSKYVIKSRREADRTRAKELASKFAFFKAEEEMEEGEDDEDSQEVEAVHDEDEEDWPGPYSTAMKIVKEREAKLHARESNSAPKKTQSAEMRIHWTPSKDPNKRPLGRMVPSLKDLCLKVLSENANEIESLDGIPDALKHRLIYLLCSSRKMNSCLLRLLVSGSPLEIRISDCSWVTERQFEAVFSGCHTNELKVLQLDICGQCMPDYVLHATLAQSPKCLASLTMLSLKGAYRLSDVGLNALLSSAPFLSSINLSQCSLITSNGIINLAERLESTMRELYIDDCQNIDAMLILPALKKLKHLEVLSVSGIETVSDKFVKKLVSSAGANIKEFGFACCRKLTSTSMKTIGQNCPHLHAIDLRNLNRLNDSAIEHLANGCRKIQKLKLCRNLFSDEAVAGFLEASGGSIVDLSLNNIQKVAEHTAVALSRHCKSTLKRLDLSFCRKMTNEALGLITDNCSQLRILKLFGCTQVTDDFLEGHSNSLVTIIGLKGPVLELMEIPGFM